MATKKKATRTQARQIEDLPVEAAADVKGGQDFHRSATTSFSWGASSDTVSPTTTKAINFS